MKFKYISKHFPTGTVTETECEFDGEADFFRFLNQWNRQGAGFYLYTSTEAYSPRAQAAHDFKHSVITEEAKRTPQSVHEAGGWWSPCFGKPI